MNYSTGSAADLYACALKISSAHPFSDTAIALISLDNVDGFASKPNWIAVARINMVVH